MNQMFICNLVHLEVSSICFMPKKKSVFEYSRALLSLEALANVKICICLNEDITSMSIFGPQDILSTQPRAQLW